MVHRRLDAATLSAIQFRGSGGDGTFDDGNETTIIPGFLGFADDNNSRVVIARFAETLPDDQYVIEIAGFDDTDPAAPVVGLRNIGGILFNPPDSEDSDRPMQSIFMDIEVGPRVVAIVPQPVVGVGAARSQMRNVVHVYFNNDPLSNPNAGVIDTNSSTLSVVNPSFYKLLYTQDTVENTDDGGPFMPTRVEYDPSLNRATLEFAGDLSELAPAAINNGVGTYRLRVGSGEAIPAPPLASPASGPTDAGDTFMQAAQVLPLGMTFGVGTQSVVVTGGVDRGCQGCNPRSGQVPATRQGCVIIVVMPQSSDESIPTPVSTFLNTTLPACMVLIRRKTRSSTRSHRHSKCGRERSWGCMPSVWASSSSKPRIVVCRLSPVTCGLSRSRLIQGSILRTASTESTTPIPPRVSWCWMQGRTGTTGTG